MAAAGAPLRAIQEWMGHSDYRTTSIYADYAPDPSQGAHYAAQPSARSARPSRQPVERRVHLPIAEFATVRRRTYDRIVAEPRRYRLMDLFAGCGGMTRGFVDSGRFEPVFAVEIDEHAAATYEANFGDDTRRRRRRRSRRSRRFPRADVVIGGPPCQGFSPLNRNGVGFERRALWREYLRALRESEAKAFVMENVPELLRSDEYDGVQEGRQSKSSASVSTGASSTPPTTASRSAAGGRS